MLVFIVASSILLGLENPLMDPKSQEAKTINFISDFLNAIFVAEALIRIIATGFYFCGEKSYLRKDWNLLDFFIVLITLI